MNKIVGSPSFMTSRLTPRSAIAAPHHANFCDPRWSASILTYALGRRVAGRRVAIVASILYGYSSLVFRYHAYERECFVAPLLLVAVAGGIDEAGADEGGAPYPGPK